MPEPAASPGSYRMGANNTSAMLAAGIAVTGTIFGVLIAALTQMAVARRTSRSQREAVSLQYQNDHEKNRRMERRRIFVEFLLSVDALVNLRVQWTGPATECGKLIARSHCCPGSACRISLTNTEHTIRSAPRWRTRISPSPAVQMA